MYRVGEAGPARDLKTRLLRGHMGDVVADVQARALLCQCRPDPLRDPISSVPKRDGRLADIPDMCDSEPISASAT